MKKYLVLILLLILMITGCSNNNSGSLNSSTKANLKEIENSLKIDSGKQYSVSHDKQNVAVISKDSSNVNSVYIINVATKKQSNLNEIFGADNLYGLSWSYDDKYLSVDDGTSVIRGTYVFNASTLKKVLLVGKNLDCVWAALSDSLACSVINDKVKLTYQGTELTNSTDVVVYNISDLSHRIVLNADAGYIYQNLIWDDYGLAAYRRFIAENTNKTEKTLLKIAK